MSDNNRITIVTVLHNSKNVIEKCLNSITVGAPVIAVDNASTDGCVELVQKIRPEVKIIKSPVNLGFGRANNLALAQSDTEFAFVLNPDTYIKPDTIDNLLKAADKYKDAAIIAPIIFYEDGSFQDSYRRSVFTKDHQKTESNKVPDSDLHVEFISGAAMLLRMSMFKEIGFFDENIFLYFEDDDICLKTIKAGRSLVVTPFAIITHLRGKASPKTYKMMFFKNWHGMWSELYLQKKYKGSVSVFKMAVRQVFIELGNLIKYLFARNIRQLGKSVTRIIAILAFVFGVKAVKK